MSWFSKSLNSTLGKKLLMALTGLFLITFLIGHLAGNLTLFKADGKDAFNLYAKFMTTNPFIKILSYVTYACIILHVIYSIVLSAYNRKARPVGYKVNKANQNSVWTSRNMGILGTIVLIFIVIHLKSFWYEMHFGSVTTYNLDGSPIKDLYGVVNQAFHQLWYVALYVVCMIFLAFHLSHGFQSAFQTLGLNHKKYTPAIKLAGLGFSILVPTLFALIPVYMYLFIEL